MRWPSWLRFKRDKGPSPELEQARERLADAKAKESEVLHLARRLREIRERNNFAALLDEAFRDRR
jgi:hypothetical protein